MVVREEEQLNRGMVARFSADRKRRGVGGEISSMTISSRDAIRTPTRRRLKQSQPFVEKSDTGLVTLDE
jgi:hypothetical protein